MGKKRKVKKGQKQSPPPSFFQIGSESRSLLNKGFNAGWLNFSLRNKISDSIQGGGRYSTDGKEGRFVSDAQYKADKCVFVQTCDKDQNFSSEVIMMDPFDVKQATAKISLLYTPTKVREGKILSSFSFSHANLRGEAFHAFDSIFTMPALKLSAVFGNNSFHAGVQTLYSSQNSRVNSTEAKCQFTNKKFEVVASVNKKKSITASACYKVTPHLSVAFQSLMKSAKKYNKLSHTGGVRYKKGGCEVAARINSDAQVGLMGSYQMSSCLKVSLCSLIEAVHFDEKSHKFGVGLEFSV